jgi:TerC family integral membrane protein
MGSDLEEPLQAETRTRSVSDITLPGNVDPDKVRNAAIWTVLSIIVSNGIGVGFNYLHPDGHEAMMAFYAGYVLELSLSLDNLFAFYLVFKYFKVASEGAQNRVLFWGILGAIVFRAIMVAAGAVALHTFRPLLLVCAAVLIWSTYQVFFMEEDDEDEDLSENGVVKFAQFFVKVEAAYERDYFFASDGRGPTPLLLVLLVIELSDIVFAVDSVPAIFGITEDPYIVWAACMCAIMCLRSLYTLIVQFVSDLPYMNKAIGLVLFFIAIKLILDIVFKIDISIQLSLSFVAGILFAGALMSIAKLQFSPEEEEEEDVVSKENFGNMAV